MFLLKKGVILAQVKFAATGCALYHSAFHEGLD